MPRLFSFLRRVGLSQHSSIWNSRPRPINPDQIFLVDLRSKSLENKELRLRISALVWLKSIV
jgi:hypothetical protein